MLEKVSPSNNRMICLGLLIALVWLSWALRLYDLEGKSIWSDEGLSIYRARKSIAFNLTNQIIVQGVVTKDTQPPLYFLLLHLLRAVAGETEFTLRYLSVLSATLILPLLYVMGKRFISAQVGLVAAFLGAASPAYLWYAQEIRMYTLLVVLSLLSVYALLRTLLEQVGWRRSKFLWLVTYLLSSGAMLYTHYSSFFLLFFQSLAIAGFILNSRRWRMMALVGVACIAALPLLPFILQRLWTGAERNFTFVPLPIILHDLLNDFTVGISVELPRVVWLDVVGLAIFLLGLLSFSRDKLWGRWNRTLFLLGYQFVPILTLYAASYVKPMYMGVRHLLIISPAYFLTVAAGFAFLARKRAWPLVVIIGLLLLGGNAYATYNYFYDEEYAKDDLRSLVHYIRQRFRPGDVLVLNDAVIGNAFDYYVPDLKWTALPQFGRVADETAIQACQALVDTYERVWFVYAPPSDYYDPHGVVRAWFDKNLFKLDFRQFTGYGVEVGTCCYATRSPVLELSSLPGVARPPGQAVPLNLLQYELPAGPNPSGEALAIRFYWWLSRPIEEDYKVSVRLLDSAGTLWAQGDSAPFLFFPTSKWPSERVIRHVHEVLLPAGTPPGRYRAELLVYHPSAGDLLKLQGPDGRLTDERILLGEVEISAAIRPVSLRQLPPHRKVNVTFGEEVALLAHTWVERTYNPGDVLHLDLYWRSEAVSGQNYHLRLQVTGDGSETLREMSAPLTLSTFPTSAWRVGDILRGQCDLTLPETLSPGEYSLRLQLYDVETGHVLAMHRGWLPLPHSWLRLPSILVKLPVAPTAIRTARPAIQHPLEAGLGEQIAFLGYDSASDTVSAGGTVSVTLYWECKGQVPISYSVFTHVIDQDNKIWGQKDSLPVGGSRPTNGWLVGEIIADTYLIPIKPETAPGRYLLEIGMYDLKGLERLPAFGGSGNRLPLDRIILGAIQVTR